MTDLVEYLKDHPGLTTKEIGAALQLQHADAVLAELREIGQVRKNTSKVIRWYSDIDFQCRLCDQCYPQVKRSGQAAVCRDCSNEKSRDYFHKSKFNSQTSFPPGSNAALSAAHLSRSLVGCKK